jgi:Arm DNA-binding domain
MKLTRTTHKTLTLPEGKLDHIYFDDDVPGFGLRLRAGGSARYIVQYDVGTITRRITIGSPKLVDVVKARDIAKDILAKVRLGGDPAQDKRTARRALAETLGAIVPRYLSHKRDKVREPRTGERRSRAQEPPSVAALSLVLELREAGGGSGCLLLSARPARILADLTIATPRRLRTAAEVASIKSQVAGRLAALGQGALMV